MSEKTPNQLGLEASERYSARKEQFDHFASTQQWAAELPEEEKVGVVNSPDVIINHLGRRLDQAVEEDRDFVEGNAVALHDLAVTLAHLEGTSITVEKPLEIGQKVDDSSEDTPDSLR